MHTDEAPDPYRLPDAYMLTFAFRLLNRLDAGGGKATVAAANSLRQALAATMNARTAGPVSSQKWSELDNAIRRAVTMDSLLKHYSAPSTEPLEPLELVPPEPPAAAEVVSDLLQERSHQS